MRCEFSSCKGDESQAAEEDADTLECRGGHEAQTEATPDRVATITGCGRS